MRGDVGHGGGGAVPDRIARPYNDGIAGLLSESYSALDVCPGDRHTPACRGDATRLGWRTPIFDKLECDERREKLKIGFRCNLYEPLKFLLSPAGSEKKIEV